MIVKSLGHGLAAQFLNMIVKSLGHGLAVQFPNMIAKSLGHGPAAHRHYTPYSVCCYSFLLQPAETLPVQ